jgi:hypothetical protein
MGSQNQHFLGAGNACLLAGLLLGLDDELCLENFTSVKPRTRESENPLAFPPCSSVILGFVAHFARRRG